MLSGAWYAATAAAEPPDEPPGTRSEVPRVGGRPERRVLGRRAHRELVHVGLAQDHGPGVAQPLRDVGVVRRAVALEDPRPGGRLAARDRDQVLERDRDPEQRVERADGRRAIGPRGRQPRIGGIGLGQRPLVVERQPRVEAMVGRVRPGQVRRGDLARVVSPARRRSARAWAVRRVRSSATAMGRPRAYSPPRIAGTTKKSPSRSGAFARTASTGRDGVATSSRRMFSSSIVWAVGGMSSVSSSASFAYWSRMWLSWPSRRVSSSSVSPSRARYATCSTSARVSVAMPR